MPRDRAIPREWLPTTLLGVLAVVVACDDRPATSATRAPAPRVDFGEPVADEPADAGPVFPDGWTAFDTSTETPFYYATDPARRPPPFAWHDGALMPNPGDAHPPRVMSAWLAGDEIRVSAWVDAPTWMPPGQIAYIAGLDGPVSTALFFPDGGGCNYTGGPGSGDRYTFNVRCANSWSRAIVGDVTAPKPIAVLPQSAIAVTDSGIFGVADGDTAGLEIVLLNWQGDLIADYLDAIGGAGFSVAVNGVLFWTAFGPNDIQVSKPGSLPLEFLPPKNQFLISDGHDLVWQSPAGDRMTAPFTADPAALAPRILLSDPDSSNPGVVGCGNYAELHESGTRVIRLADGATRTFEQVAARPLAIGCTDVLVVSGSWVLGPTNDPWDTGIQVGRIRL